LAATTVIKAQGCSGKTMMCNEGIEKNINVDILCRVRLSVLIYCASLHPGLVSMEKTFNKSMFSLHLVLY